MDFGNFQFILNNHFITKHCVAHDGNDTPTLFHCTKGFRKWSRFFYLENGIVDFTSHTGKKLRMKSGDIIFLPYDIEYSSSWLESDNGHYYSVEFILEYPNGENLNLYDDITYLFNDNGFFKELFIEISDTYMKGTLGFQLKTQQQFLNLLYSMAMHLKNSDNHFRDIRPAISDIEENLHDKIDIDKLAEKCHISPATFRRKFLKYASMSPVSYRNYMRINKARELIGTGLYKIHEVAEIVGISDIYYFSKLYKNQFGVSPSSDLPE